jgi:hypothetical protein
MAAQVGCARVAGTVEAGAGSESRPPETGKKEVAKMAVMVGRKAPDFETSAYFKGGFINVKLSDALGHWVLLCFYPGDFTFV